MSSYYLLNGTFLGTTLLWPGQLLDESLFPIAQIVRAGGRTWPSTDPAIAAASAEVALLRKKGASVESCSAVMLTAAAVAADDSPGGSTGDLQVNQGGALAALRRFDLTAPQDGDVARYVGGFGWSADDTALELPAGAVNGDLFYYDGTGLSRVTPPATSTETQTLRSVNGTPAWLDLHPVQRSLTAWLPASYSGTPWVGKQSAGGSLNRNWSEATNPATVHATPLNGFTVASFNGTNKWLSNLVTTANTLLGTTNFGIAMTVWIDSINPSSSDTALEILAGHNSYRSIGTRLVGGLPKVTFSVFTSSYIKVDAPIVTGAWNHIQARHTGTQISIRVNGGAWATPVNCGAAAGDEQIWIGKAANATSFFAGRAAEFQLRNATWTDAEGDDILAYSRARYRLPLA